MAAAVEDFSPGNAFGNAAWLGNSDQTLLSAFLVLHHTLNRHRALPPDDRAVHSSGLLWEGLLPHRPKQSGYNGNSALEKFGSLHSAQDCKTPPILMGASFSVVNFGIDRSAAPCVYVAAKLNDHSMEYRAAKEAPSVPSELVSWIMHGRAWLRQCCLPRIDHCQQLFAAAASPDEQSIQNQFKVDNGLGLVSTLTGKRPAVLHAPGKACSTKNRKSKSSQNLNNGQSCEPHFQVIRNDFVPPLHDCPE